MKKSKKIYYLMLTAVLVLLLLATAKTTFAEPQCQIQGSKSGATVDINAVAECVENRYAFDKDMLRRAKKKEAAPIVEIHFDKTDPKEGEKVTAIAVPKYFRNDNENLYYTWYLIHTAGARNTIGEGKREAMSIVARGDFDPDLFGIDYSVDNDDDGFLAPFGGADGVGAKSGGAYGSYDDHPDVMFDYPKQIVDTDAISRCYDHNFGRKFGAGEDPSAGRDMIIECEHRFVNCGGVTGDGVFGAAEEQCWGTDPTNPDTDGDGVRDEADVLGLNQQQFTWTYREGDLAGVVVEGTSSIPINEGGEDHVYFSECHWEADINGSIVEFPSRDAAMEECRSFLENEVTQEGLIEGGTSTSTGTITTDPITGNQTTSTETTIPDQNTTSTADLALYNDGVALYDQCVESIIKVCEYRNPNDPVYYDESITNAYYKIMWATPDFDEDGFNYHATIPIDEKGREILDPELDFIPKNPQFVSQLPDNSDIITVSAGINNDEVDEDFLYYTWRIMMCEANDFFTCEENVSGLFEWESFQNGLGVKEINVIPTAGLIGGASKVWVKAVVVVSRHEDYVGGEDVDRDQGYFPIGAIAEVMIPITRNDMTIQLFRAIASGGRWVAGEEICVDGVYRDICPVYPFEVLMARAVSSSDLYAWQLNNQQIPPPLNDVLAAGNSQYGPEVFFPIYGSGKSIGTISATAKQEVTDLISERMYTVYNPVGVIVPASGNLQQTVRYDGTPSEYAYEAPAGSTVALTVEELIPNYMDFSEVTIQWYINGQQAYDGVAMNQGFLLNNPQINAAVSGDGRTIEFIIDGTWGQGLDVACRIEKVFTPEEQRLLSEAWAINNPRSLTQDSNVTVKVAYSAPFDQAPFGSKTLSKFLASSLANAPHYLIFIVRLAVAMVLVWAVLFGFSYAVRLNE